MLITYYLEVIKVIFPILGLSQSSTETEKQKQKNFKNTKKLKARLGVGRNFMKTILSIISSELLDP